MITVMCSCMVTLLAASLTPADTSPPPYHGRLLGTKLDPPRYVLPVHWGFILLHCSARYTLSVSLPLYSIHSVRKVQPITLKEQNIKLPEGLLFLCRNFHSVKLYIHPHNTYDADGLRELMEKHFLLEKVLQ